MGRTPDAYDGPRIDEAVIWEEQTSDPTEAFKTQYVQDKGLVILDDGVVRGVGEARENIWQFPSDDRDVNTPPGSPATGYRVIVGSSPTGAFVGHSGEIAQWTGTAWVFTVPKHGTQTHVKDENEPYKQTATSSPWVWAKVDTGGGLPNPTQMGEVLFSRSSTSLAFTVELPVTSCDGWLVDDQGIHIVVG